jgi:type II secretion system protein J
MSPRRRRIDRGGFTMIEVIVTILIMAGIMLTITQILNAVRNSRDRIHNMQEAHLAGPALLDRIENDLRALSTYGRDPALALRVKNRVIQGLDADSIDFVVDTNSLVIEKQASADRFVRADACEVGYRLRTNAENDDFLELWRREDFGIDEEPFDGGRYSFLHDRVKGFRIEVFEEDGPDAEPLENWGTENDEHTGLPARIEIEVTIELAPRLVRETLVQLKREVTFKRIYRFPESLRAALEIQPVPFIPSVPPAIPRAGEPGAQGETPLSPGSGGDAGNPFEGFGSGSGSADGFNPFGG